MTGVLHNKVLLKMASAAVTASPWIPVDYRFGTPDQSRSIIGTRSDGNCEVQVYVRNGALDKVTNTIIYVTATATIWTTGASQFSTVIVGPMTDIQVKKVGASGTATIIGVI